METLLKKMESEAGHVEKKAANLRRAPCRTR